MRPKILGTVLFTAVLWNATAHAGEPIRLGLLHTLSPAPFYIAQERGYFHDEGIDLSFRFFEAAQPIAAAAVSGDIDVGVTALTGGFFNLAEKGTLKVIGGALHEEAHYEGSAVLASNKAYDDGLTSLDKLPGHSVAITQYGSSFHYMMGRIAEAKGFDLKSITLRPVQQIANMVAAPLSWYLMNRWLQAFPYRVGMSWWMFATAFGAGCLVTMATLSVKTIKAALANPVLALRSE